MTRTLDELRGNAEIRDQLYSTCDFEVADARPEPTWFSIDGFSDVPVIGRDGSGGVFVVLPRSHVLYVSSEGAAGVVADDLDSLIDDSPTLKTLEE